MLQKVPTRARPQLLFSSALLCSTLLRPRAGHAALDGEDTGRDCSPLLASLASPPPADGDAVAPSPLPAVLDALGVLDAPQLARLNRILLTLQRDMGYRLRVVTQDRASAACVRGALDAWRVGRHGGVAADAVVLVAERGIAGSLESGGSFLKPIVGDDILLALPPVFWARLRREYGGGAYVRAKGEAASVVTACELIISCLRNEAFCVDVPPASASFF